MTDEEWEEMTRKANNCPYRNPDCPTCNPPAEAAPVSNGERADG